MTMITPSYLGETIEYSSLHACRSTLEDPTSGDFYDPDNLQGLCRSCHSSKTAVEGGFAGNNRI